MGFESLSKDNLQNILKFLDFKEGLGFSKLNKFTHKVANENLGILKVTAWHNYTDYVYNIYFTNRQYMNVILKMGIGDGQKIEMLTNLLNNFH